MKTSLETASKQLRRGSALIETALASTVMFLMLSGVIDFGRAFYYTDLAASAARAGAQYGIESAANVGNVSQMKIAAYNDANASCQDTNNATVTCGAAAQTQAHVGPGLNLVVTPTYPYCVNSTGNNILAVSGVCPAGYETYLKVSTLITYNLLVPWPGLPNPLQIGGVAIMRAQ
jgi:Flp pilus assembly protein TadG